MQTTINTGRLTRSMNFDRAAVDEESRTVRLSFSSEEPVERSFGMEVLSHDPEHVRMDRLEASAPLLWNHNTDVQIGVVENASIENGRGTAVVKFSKSARGEELYQDVLDGISTSVSVGYRINAMELVEGEGPDTYRAIDWMPHEISLVSVPADFGVGVGREIEGEHLTRVLTPETKTIKGKPRMVEQSENVDVQSVRDNEREAVLKEESRRIEQIQKASQGAAHLRDLANEAIATRMSFADFSVKALELGRNELSRMQSQETVNAPLPTVDMSEKERNQYSVARALQAAVAGDWKDAGLELEVSKDIARTAGGVSESGFYVPMNAAWGSRDLTAGTDNQGGFLVPTDHRAGDFIEALRAKMVVGQAGATYMSNLSGNVAIPKLATGTAVEWVAEGSAPTEGQPVFGQVTLTPKNLVGYVEMTQNLILQSAPTVEGIVQRDIANGLAVALDAAAITGSGSSNQPTGILATLGIGAPGSAISSTGEPTFGEMVAIESEITADNADSTDMVYITTPAVAGFLKTKALDSGSGRFVLENGMVNGYRLLFTSSMTANTVLLGNFSDLIIGQFGALKVLTETDAKTGIVTLALHMHADLAVRHAQSFAKNA